MKRNICYLLFSLSLLSCKKDHAKSYTFEINLVKQSYYTALELLFANSQNYADSVFYVVSGFTDYPIENRFNDSKAIWKKSFSKYNLLGPYLYSSGTVSNPLSVLEQRVGLTFLNAAFLDYVQVNPASGIVFDEVNYPAINMSTVPSWHQLGGQGNLTLGYHAIEFMLYGEDLTLSQAGQRTRDDYIKTDNFKNRRCLLLYFMSVILSKDFSDVDIKSNFKNSFLDLDNSEAMAYMLSGLKNFIEKDFIERTLYVPINSLNRDDELSPYADNTLDNIKDKIKSIRLFFDPSSIVTDGEGFHMIHLMELVSEDDASTVKAKLDALENTANSISTDFENALTNSSELNKLKSIITDLEAILAAVNSFESKI